MADPEPFGPVIFVGAEAVGIPGQRRFRLKAMAEDGRSAMLWLEKEQLIALGDAIETVLNDEGIEVPPWRPDDAEPEPVFPLKADIDYRLGQLSMGVDRDRREIVVIGAPGNEGDGQAISISFAYERGAELRSLITTVVAAGRPPCPLCMGPMDPSGHVCPKRNGHHPQN